MKHLIPLQDRVLVEAVEEEKQTASGILLPESQEKKPGKGKIIAVGEGKLLDNGSRLPMDLKVGEIIHFSKYAADEVEMDGKMYLSVSYGSIYVVER